MPIVQIHMLEGRTPELKEKLIYNVTQTIHETLNAPVETIRVILDEMPLQHFGIAGESVKKRREQGR